MSLTFVKATSDSQEVTSPLLGGSRLGITPSGHEGTESGLPLHLAQFNLVHFRKHLLSTYKIPEAIPMV